MTEFPEKKLYKEWLIEGNEKALLNSSIPYL